MKYCYRYIRAVVFNRTVRKEVTQDLSSWLDKVQQLTIYASRRKPTTAEILSSVCKTILQGEEIESNPYFGYYDQTVHDSELHKTIDLVTSTKRTTKGWQFMKRRMPKILYLQRM